MNAIERDMSWPKQILVQASMSTNSVITCQQSNFGLKKFNHFDLAPILATESLGNWKRYRFMSREDIT